MSDRRARMSEELELKYSIDDPRAVARWLDSRFPPGEGERWRTVSMTDRYFDTADLALSAAGYGARLRRARGRTTLTLKSDLEVSGALHRRMELEGRATDELDVHTWPAGEARDRLHAITGERRLIERFTIAQRRRERPIGVAGAQLLMSIDTGEVKLAGVSAGSIAQLELELVRGRRSALSRVAREVESGDLTVAEPRSKLVIAAEMAARASRVLPDDAFAEAGRKVLRRHLLRLLEREPATRATDALALKQMRVAARRMRATWRVFEEAYRGGIRRRLEGDLRRIGRALGAVRDLDVLLASLPDDQRLTPLADYWHLRRRATFDELERLLESKRYARFVDASLAFTSSSVAGSARRAGTVAVAYAAPPALRAALARMLSAGASAIGSDDLDAWHALRIEGRRFRYSLEAFRDVLEPAALAEVLRRVTLLQDHLGGLNDAVVARDAVSAWLADSGAAVGRESRAAAEALISRHRATIDDRRASFSGLWRQVSSAAFARQVERSQEPLLTQP